jgi:GTP-binding protein Era
MPFRSGFVAIIGRPNAGKSTLLNRLVGQKIAIVTHKAQTTRNRIVGVVNVAGKKGNNPAAQIVFVDTPGVHKPGSPMERRMMQEVYDALAEHNLVLLIVDAKRTFDEADEYVLELLRRGNAQVVLLLNKIDLIAKDKLLPLIQFYRDKLEFKDIVPISAEKGLGTQELLDVLVGLLPEGPRYFPVDQVTDQPERFIAAEMIREKVLMMTGQEVPYSTAVIVERWEEPQKKGAATRIAAAIYVEREGQKAIIIGKGGTLLKKIGTSSRIELEKMLDNKVFLELFVKVRENWRESRQFLNELDWRQQLEALGTLESLPKRNE